ncbi:MAG: FKBP-type peptidyl-prolyl cis-trans isomerase [Chitinophagaceae bacterium]|nr:FKBP-type peptidyl-prolyl cis-trans isomerase [Chitinophagaceae bacterium]
MKQLFYLIITSLILFSCTQSTKKFKDGTEYKIISDGKGQKIVNGNFIEVEILKKYKDSVLYNSREIMPQFGLYDTAQFPPLFKEIFKNIRVGDSVFTRNLVDSIYKESMPPFAKKGEYETTTYKFINAFTTKEQTDSAYNKWLPIAKERTAKKQKELIVKELKTNEPQLKADDKILSDYIAAHQLTAVKAPWGTYVVITTPGTGENLNDSSIAVVNYTGRTLVDSVFDSNTDIKFGHRQPINVDLSQVGSVILGWTDGLKQMKKGSKGKFFIPSSLGYGKTGSGDKIKPNENLIFDIEVTDVLTPAQYQAKQLEQQQKMMEMQQKMQQQMQQRRPDSSAK